MTSPRRPAASPPRPRDPEAEIDRCRSQGQCLPGVTVTVSSLVTRPPCPLPFQLSYPPHPPLFLLRGKGSPPPPAPRIWAPAPGPEMRAVGRHPGAGVAEIPPAVCRRAAGDPRAPGRVQAQQWHRGNVRVFVKEPARSLDFLPPLSTRTPPTHTYITDAKIILPSGKSRIWRPSSESNGEVSSQE